MVICPGRMRSAARIAGIRPRRGRREVWRVVAEQRPQQRRPRRTGQVQEDAGVLVAAQYPEPGLARSRPGEGTAETPDRGRGGLGWPTEEGDERERVLEVHGNRLFVHRSG